MIEDLKNIEKQIDRLWQDIRRVRGEIPEYPDDIAAGVDQDLVEASGDLYFTAAKVLGREAGNWHKSPSIWRRRQRFHFRYKTPDTFLRGHRIILSSYFIVPRIVIRITAPHLYSI